MKRLVVDRIENHRAIRYIDIEDAVIISKRKLSQCEMLEDIVAAPNNRRFTAECGVLYSKDMTRLLKYPPRCDYKEGHFDFPLSVATIDEAAFNNCAGLVSADTKNVSVIEGGAFYCCHSLKFLTIGSKLSELKPSYFKFCFELMYISVDEQNPYYKSIDGVVFSKDGKKLIFYPSGKNDIRYTVPESVEVIGKDAFKYNFFIESIVLPDSLVSIEESAFELCTDLHGIEFGKGIEMIGRRAFSNCEDLRTIDLPPSLQDIDDYAFAMCGTLHGVYAQSSPRISETAFIGTAVKDAKSWCDGSEIAEISLNSNEPDPLFLKDRYLHLLDKFCSWHNEDLHGLARWLVFLDKRKYNRACFY